MRLYRKPKHFLRINFLDVPIMQIVVHITAKYRMNVNDCSGSYPEKQSGTSFPSLGARQLNCIRAPSRFDIDVPSIACWRKRTVTSRLLAPWHRYHPPKLRYLTCTEEHFVRSRARARAAVEPGVLLSDLLPAGKSQKPDTSIERLPSHF